MKLENAKLTKNSEKASEKILENTQLSKSAKMKSLFDLGYDVKTIAQKMQVRYNFAYNVISNYIITNDLKTTSEHKENKKDKIISLFNAGKSNKEIAIELKTNYNYVYKITSEIKKQQALNTKQA